MREKRSHIAVGLAFVGICAGVGAALFVLTDDQPQTVENQSVSITNVAELAGTPIEPVQLDVLEGLTVKDGLLLFNGKPTAPRIEADQELSVSKLANDTDGQLYLVRNSGGTACPMLFRVAEEVGSAVRISDEFGTCSDEVSVSVAGETVQISMPGYQGPFEDENAQSNASNELHVFTYANGSVAEAVQAGGGE